MNVPNSARSAVVRRLSTDSQSPSMQDQTPAQRSVCELFRRFDSDNDGALSEAEFRRAFAKLTRGSLTDAQVDKMVEAVDVNRDGVIDIFEFTVWLYSKNSKGGRKSLVSPPSTSELAALSNELTQLREQSTQLQAEVKVLQAELKVKKKALEQMEVEHEEEVKVTHDFWRSVAQHVVVTIDKKVNLDGADWLGNGKYGFVMRARRREDGRDVVLKMMGIRWAHLAVKEWQHGAMIGKHPSIVEYDEVMIHNDDDSMMRNMIQAGYEQGSLKSKARSKRTQFPDRYICLMQEFMNRGTIQDWIDDDQLRPGGMFVVMRKVASALAFLHDMGVTHNDIKPENVMVHVGREMVDGDAVVVKLGDLGLTTRSSDQSADFWQYGMTVFCMTTGERFGSRKYRPAAAQAFVAECRTACEAAVPQGRLRVTLDEVPEILRVVFAHGASMAQISERACLQGWKFFDDGDRCVSRDERASKPLARPTQPQSRKVNAKFEGRSVHRVVSQMSPNEELIATPPPGG
ncbi:unnamed protein product [Prorocentrum cordatum]|uniref:Calmodulin n=1 Tax=Prorocentrum cordatum TaxID=2364126 RepID=A0ABN9XIH1_9DINO|nr:unnamed protein product [Polarella glacialis]